MKILPPFDPLIEKQLHVADEKERVHNHFVQISIYKKKTKNLVSENSDALIKSRNGTIWIQSALGGTTQIQEKMSRNRIDTLKQKNYFVEEIVCNKKQKKETK